MLCFSSCYTPPDKLLGVLSLTNRPLTLCLQELENDGIPTNIGRENTYDAVEPYILDLLAYHDSRLRCQPNSINDEVDCRAQMAALTAMRGVLPHFIDRNSRGGPFLFTLTDIHQSNIYVDEQWNIKRLIDLEWVCSLPSQMQTPPYWLTNQGVDHLTGGHLNEYEKAHKEFMEIFEHEEYLQNERTPSKVMDEHSRANTMRRAWKNGSFFYFHALDSTTGLFNLWVRNIQPMFSKFGCLNDELNRHLAPYWGIDTEGFIASKGRDRDPYIRQLRALFKDQNQILPS